ASYEGQDDIQLMRFANYFGRTFSDSILADLANQQGVTKGSKKGAQTTSSKSQAAISGVIEARRRLSGKTTLTEKSRSRRYFFCAGKWHRRVSASAPVRPMEQLIDGVASVCQDEMWFDSMSFL
nr:hypothetical protein [Tanacetum cinerariifolium]